MNWEAIGAIGETISAIAVFATLMFLAVQIRQSNRVNEANTRISIAEMKHRSNDSITRFSEALIADPELSSIWDRGRSGEALSSEDQSRFLRLARNYFGLHATSYYDYDAIDDHSSKNRMIDYMVEQISANHGLEVAWKNLKETPFTNYAEFWNGVNQRLMSRGT